jgi:hypothetical protein
MRSGLRPVSLVILCLLALSFPFSCRKKAIEKKVMEPSFLNKFFEENVLNRDITVLEARQDGRDTLSIFNGYVFKLLKNTYYDGPFEAKANGNTYLGTWQSNDDYSKLVLDIHGQPPLEWVCLTWKFSKKTTTSLELVPWFNTDGDRFLKFAK